MGRQADPWTWRPEERHTHWSLSELRTGAGRSYTLEPVGVIVGRALRADGTCRSYSERAEPSLPHLLGVNRMPGCE